MEEEYQDKKYELESEGLISGDFPLLLGFAIAFAFGLFRLNLPWRISFLIGVLGFCIGGLGDRALRWSY